MSLNIDTENLGITPPAAPRDRKHNKFIHDSDTPTYNKIKVEISNYKTPDINLSCNINYLYSINFVEKKMEHALNCNTKIELFELYKQSFLEWIPDGYESYNISFDKVCNLLAQLGYFQIIDKFRIIWNKNKYVPINKHIRFKY